MVRNPRLFQAAGAVARWGARLILLLLLVFAGSSSPIGSSIRSRPWCSGGCSCMRGSIGNGCRWPACRKLCGLPSSPRRTPFLPPPRRRLGRDARGHRRWRHWRRVSRRFDDHHAGAKNLFLAWPLLHSQGSGNPLAVVLDFVWPKRRILEIYLNIAEWGDDGLFGAEAAANSIFMSLPPCSLYIRRRCSPLSARSASPQGAEAEPARRDPCPHRRGARQIRSNQPCVREVTALPQLRIY